MNEENKNFEPVTDLGLALRFSNQCTQRKLENDSGAGANAGSRVDMKFVASDPLSELVWSPENGLSLKCADCSFANKKPSFLWNAGPSNTVFSTSSSDKPLNKENYIISQGVFCVRSEMDGRDTLAKTSETDSAVMPVCGSNHECIEVKADETGVRNEPSSGNPIGGVRDIGNEKQTSRMEIVLDSEVRPTNECEANNTLVQIWTSPVRAHEESALFAEKVRKNKMTMTIGLHPLEKLESTSENDVKTLILKNSSDAEKKIVASEFAHEIKHCSQRNEEILLKDKTVSGENSPTNSRILIFQREGKEKALSDGDDNGRMSKEDCESHESVESCNSTELLSTGKKRWSFERQSIGGSKIVKRQIHDSPCSASLTKQDSSFMNWISNMMKGVSKSNQDQAPCLALTLAHPDHSHESRGHKFIACNKNQDSGCRNVGFQSIFHSLYCPKTTVQERTLDDHYQRKLELGNRLCDITSAIPIACHGDNNNLCKEFLISNEKFNESRSGNGADPVNQPKISSANFAGSQESSKMNSAENKNSCNVTAGKVNGGTDSISSMKKHKTSSAENTNSEPASEVKTTLNFNNGSDPLRSLWITRFTPKTSFPSLNLQTTSEAHEGTTNYHVNHSNDLNIVEAGPHSIKNSPMVAKELENCAAAVIEASTGFNKIKGHNDQKSIYKLNPIFPSPRFKNSEAMASVFARRLDALKHVMPSDVTDTAVGATVTCFFCGRKGHHLQDCSEIAAGELEYLLKNINSYNGAEELPCFCIRCFQLNHWAVACPNASTRVQRQLESGASLGNVWSPIGIQLNKRNEENTKLLVGNKRTFHASGAHTVCLRNDSVIETGLKDNWKMSEVASSDRMTSNANLVNDYISSSSEEKKLKEDRIMPFCKFVNKQISEVPKGIFDAIKGLRLSRTDILKWVNSHMSLAHLNGFFLRLRLGKWEEGFGGTGYYVACITGTHRESSTWDSKNSISVNVGGIKCWVESQYISNHDFLEDELMAWWSATAKSGIKIPSEEDLRIKSEERKMLGL